MFSKQDAAQAAGVSAPQNEVTPSAKTGGSKKNLHFIERLSRRLASLWWLDLCSMAVLLAVIVSFAIERLTGGAV